MMTRHETILRRSQVEARTGLSRSGIYRSMANGRFPPPIQLGPRAVGWLESDVDHWIEERVRESRRSKCNSQNG